MFANIFGLPDEKNRAFSQKVFFTVFNRKSCFRRIVLKKKVFSFEKVFFSVIIFGIWVIFLSFCKTVVRYVKPPIILQREINGNYNLEKLFSLNNFGLWAEKTWTFSKTVRHDSQNRSIHAQMNTFRIFSGIKNICMKVFGHWRETSDFWLKCFLRVVKAAFQVSSATLRENMIKVNFTFCRLFRTVCVFICSDGKGSQGFQNHRLSVQRKTLGRKFQTQMLSKNISSFWAEKLGVLSENYQHGCQNCKLRTFRKFWGKTVFFFKLNCKLVRTLRLKKRALVVKKFSSGFLQQEFAPP